MTDTATAAPTDRDRWLTKIEALLRKAEAKGATPEEAAAFTAKAEELMAKWKIAAADLRAAQTTTDPTESVETRQVIIWKSAMMLAEVALLLQVASAHDCRLVYWNFKGRYNEVTGKAQAGREFKIYGMPEDLDTVLMLFASLKIQATAEYTSPAVVAQRREVCGTGASAGGKAIRFKNSFMSGYASKIGQRLHAIRRHMAETVSSSTALALVDSSKAVDEVFERKNPSLRKGTSLKGGQGGAGWGAGYTAADRAKLQDSIR